MRFLLFSHSFKNNPTGKGESLNFNQQENSLFEHVLSKEYKKND